VLRRVITGEPLLSQVFVRNFGTKMAVPRPYI
jgi:hypothetical protein